MCEVPEEPSREFDKRTKRNFYLGKKDKRTCDSV